VQFGIRRRVRLVFAISFVVSLIMSGAQAQPVTTPARPAVFNGHSWFLRNSLTAGFADSSFVYGTSSREGIPLMGDWNGDGVKTPGIVYEGNKWYLRNSNTSGKADIFVWFGFRGGIPVAGDWDGDGVDTPGMVDVISPMPGNATSSSAANSCPGLSTWYLRNSNTWGVADETFDFGCAGDPVVGDWNGDGPDGFGIRQAGTNFWDLTDTQDATAVTLVHYGSAHHFPIVGDWDGDGDDTVGVISGNTWLLNNQDEGPSADVTFKYGVASHRFLVWGQAP
jgi:hypothetical protein